MEIKKNHIRIGDYIIQHRLSDARRDGVFVVLDTREDNAQIGCEYDHLYQAMEKVLKYND